MSEQAQNGTGARAARRAGGRTSTRGPRAWLALAALAAILGASVATVALARGSTAATVASAANAKLGVPVLIGAQGRTLYALTPETSRRLLCKSAECLHVWPPLTVASPKAKLKAGGGVQGRLGVVRRGDGRFQVTLRGVPLYRFSGDHGRDESNGEGIESFGGTWHAVRASGGATVKPTQSGSAESPPAPYAAPAPQAPSAPAPASTTPSTPTTTSAPTTMPTTTPTYTYPY